VFGLSRCNCADTGIGDIPAPATLLEVVDPYLLEVPYSKRNAVSSPSGPTVPASVAELTLTFFAASVRASGAFTGDSPEEEGVCRAVGVTGAEGPEAGPVPTAFVAVAVKVYAWPLISPETVIGLERPLTVLPSLASSGLVLSCAVSSYPVIGLPLSDGAENDTTASPSDAVADTSVGAPGTAAGITAADGSEEGPVPALFEAVTVKV
jgi:hypothetical protein